MLSRVFAGLAALALVLSAGTIYADRALFSADGFAQRADAALRSGPVAAEAARRMSNAALQARPDLVAVAPLVRSAAESVVRSEAFGSVVRGTARDVHRSVFDRNASTLTLTVVDAGVLLNEALSHVRPGAVPEGLQVRFAAATSDADTAALRLAQAGDDNEALAWIAALLAVVFGAGAVISGRRAGVIRLAVAVVVVCGLAALAAYLAPYVLLHSDAARAVAKVWLDPLAVWFGAL